MFEEIFKQLIQKRKEHELKWEIPEAKISSAIKNADETVAQLKKLAHFVGGGEYSDTIYAKQFAESIYAYFIIRTEQNTENETAFFEGYQIQESEKLGVQLSNKYRFIDNLRGLGYAEAFSRKLRQWNFNYKGLPVQVFDIQDFAPFIQITLTPTKIESQRKLNQLTSNEILTKLNITKENLMPIDVITLQFYVILQQAQQQTS